MGPGCEHPAREQPPSSYVVDSEFRLYKTQVSKSKLVGVFRYLPVQNLPGCSDQQAVAPQQQA